MIVRRALHFVTGFLPLRVIDAEGELDPQAMMPLFERYFVCQAPRWLGGWTVYLHHYLRSDPDRGPHDHPWSWAVSLPLAAGYVEERLDGFNAKGPRLRYIRRRPFVPYRLTGRDFHRVISNGRTSWSLFIHGPYTKGWGFLRSTHAVPLPDGGVYRFESPEVRFHPFKNDNDGSARWWRTAPRGRDQERAAA